MVVSGDVGLSLNPEVSNPTHLRDVTAVLTLATQVTRCPLNSRLSSFSTAVLKSAAFSNSTKLQYRSADMESDPGRNYIPFTILVARSLAINDIKSGLTSKVLEILKSQVE